MTEQLSKHFDDKRNQQQTEQEVEIQEEIPEDAVDPEGISTGWKTVRKEIEIDGEKIEVSYREKNIDLPEYRQEETGIKKIKRRELLPPFPKGLYIPSREGSTNYFSYYSAEEKFDEFYRFFTDGGYPCLGTFVHIMNYREKYNQTGRVNPDIERFKKEEMYFQKIKATYGGQYFYHYRTYSCEYTTPIFVFGNKSRVLNNYIDAILADPSIVGIDISELSILKKDFSLTGMSDSDYHKMIRAEEIMRTINNYKSLRNRKPPEREEISLHNFIEIKDQKGLRWCNAELAIIPTKRGLNVLFFDSE